MNEAVKEIKKEIKILLKRHMWVKWICIVLLMISIYMIIKVSFFPTIDKGFIGGNDSKEWQQMSSYFDGEDVEFDFDISDTEHVINRFFISANRQDVDRFVSLMNSDTNSNDFLDKADNITERFELYDAAMARLSRGNSIEKLEIVDGNKMVGGKMRVLVNVFYSDLANPIRLTLILEKEDEQLSVSDYTGDLNDDEQIVYKQYYIASSVWKMIEEIENEVN